MYFICTGRNILRNTQRFRYPRFATSEFICFLLILFRVLVRQQNTHTLRLRLDNDSCDTALGLIKHVPFDIQSQRMNLRVSDASEPC